MLPLHRNPQSRRRWFHIPIAVPILLFLTVFLALLVSMTESISRTSAQGPISTAHGDQEQHKGTHFNFAAPPSYFLPSLPSTNPVTFDPTTTNFGLISQSYNSDSALAQRHSDGTPPTDWQRFAHHLSSLNKDAPTGTSYHVLYLARHGQGYHNLAESYYGTQSWDCYWAQLDGDPDSNISWADARLSKLGEQQAREQSRFWKTQLDEAKMPNPGRWFVSPMERACRTAEITFAPLVKSGRLNEGWKPTVKEFLRETNGVHSCDRRSRRSMIAKTHPGYEIEEGFTEEDELWDPVYRETDDAHTYRASLLLDDVLGQLRTEDGESYISLTAHGGMINAILRAIGHRQFQVKVGSAIAVLVKAEIQEGKRQHHDFKRGKTKPDCFDDPLEAGLPGYRNFEDYVNNVEASVQA